MAYNLEHIDPGERTELYADPRAPEEEPPHSGRLLRIAGALAVMAVFAGGLWFAYTQGLRHTGGSAGPGEVPLVRADASPIKVKPEKPGGMPIPDRDMLIYGQQQPQIEHLLPQPEQPMARPIPPPAGPPPVSSTGSAAPSSASLPKQAAIPPAAQHPLSAPPEEATARPPSQQPPLASPEQTLGGAPPPSPGTTPSAQPQTPNAAATRPAAPLHAVSETGPPVAERAQPTPDIIGQKIEQLEAAAVANRGKRSETARAGRLRLQLGAMRSESEARGAWERLKHKNTDLLGNLSAVAVRADLGGKGVYYRIETGPISDPTTADRVCGELRQRHLACMIVR
jgi:hypothetical protein